MTDFALQAEQETGREFFTTRKLTLAVAFFFIVFGVEKLTGTGGWIGVFERIGLGQWFRYFTGVVQVGGALLMVVKRTALIGVLMLASTMVGAVIVQLVVVGSVSDAAFPGFFLLAILIAGAFEFADRRR